MLHVAQPGYTGLGSVPLASQEAPVLVSAYSRQGQGQSGLNRWMECWRNKAEGAGIGGSGTANTLFHLGGLNLHSQIHLDLQQQNC